MSRMGSACNCNGVASEYAASHASRASDAHMPSATKRASSNPAKSPTSYDKTAAILLGWESGYCDTGVEPEVRFQCTSALNRCILTHSQLASLAKVLREEYNFVVESHLMHTRTAPQKQAFKHLSNFVDAHDDPQTLLIVYYAGHGYQSLTQPGHLALSGKPIYDESAMIAASIEWHEVERTLVATSSDVLVIFDCCRAGLLCRSAQEGLENNDRIFQCLGACESEQRTRSSGKQSFTTAMIWALEELAKEPSFPVTKLVKKIEAHAGFPHDDQRPVLFGGRFAPASANIHLARMPSLVPNGH